jgi:predicted outer membrane repeat protein
MFRRVGIVLILFLMIAAPFGTVHAAGVVGDGTPGSCTEAALTAALSGGGAVSFNCGGPQTILITSQKTISQDTLIQGGSVITITGGLATSLFHVVAPATLTLEDITLDSAYNVNSDGGAIVSSGTLSLKDVTIKNSQTGNIYCGGAIWASGAVSITDSKFEKNSAGSGGALCTGSLGTARLQVTDSSFVSNQAVNTAGSSGGAIWVGPAAKLVFTGGELNSNSAYLGGAIYAASNASVTLTGASQPVSVDDNAGSTSGGAIYNDGGHLEIINANFIGNKTLTNISSDGYGGAITNLGDMRLFDSFLDVNQSHFGGAVFVGGSLSGAQASIERTIFEQNQAAELGGGLYTNVETTTVTVTNSVFEGNIADAGGGIARYNANLSVSKSSLTRNTARLGGGLFVGAIPQPSSGGYVKVSDTTLSTNTASSGQGGGLYNDGEVDLGNVTIKDNTNGIFNFGTGEVTLIHNTVLQNSGSLNCDGDGTLPTSAGGNFSTDNSCGLTSPSDRQGIGLDPLLGPLAKDPASFTSYHLPQAGSPLINAAVTPCSPSDQRYALRPDACDIGAVEYGGLLPRDYAPLIIK